MSTPAPVSASQTKHALFAALSICLLIGSTLAMSVAAPSGAAIISSDLSVVSDGTGHGTGSACSLMDGASLVDAGPNDGVVCTNDTVTFGWSFNLDEGGATNATFEQTLPENWSWDPISVPACEGNGIDYTGVATISNGGRTLTCVINQPASNNTASLQIPVVARVGATAQNATSYAGQLTITENGGTPQVSDATPVVVRAAPRFELKKAPTGGQGNLANVDFGSGPEAATYADFRAYIEVPDASNPKGVEPLASPFTFVENVDGISPNAKVISVFGLKSGTGTFTQTAPGAPATMTVTGANTGAIVGGLTPAAVWYGSIRIALPTSEVPASPVGKDIVNRYDQFTPTGIYGTANLNGVPEQGSEPGANCDYLDDPNTPNVPNNNCAKFHLKGTGGGGTGTGPTGAKTIHQRTPGGVECAKPGTDIAVGNACPKLPGDTGSENGYALAGDALWARVYLYPARDPKGETIPVTNLAGCDSWNPQLQQIDPTGTLKFGYPNEIPSDQYTVEYTDRALATDAARQAAGCGIPGNSTIDGPWFPSIAAAGGPAAVSGVRVVYTGSPTFGVGGAAKNQQVFLYSVPMTAGKVPGAVPDFFTTRWDERVTKANQTGSFYTARSGYRNTQQILAVDKDTSPSGKISTATGATVNFTLAPTVSVPNNIAPDPVTGLVVTDVLGPCMLSPVLSPASTEWTMAITTPANPGADGLPCTGDSETGATLTFTHIGPVAPNKAVQPIAYSIQVSNLVKNGASISNTAVVSADGNGQPPKPRTDAYTLTVAAPGAVKISKTADFPLVEVEPDDLAWTIAFSNTILSPTTAGFTEFIDVLPYNGDNRGTAFSGTYDVASISYVGAQTDVSLVFTDKAPGFIDTDPSTNTDIWCAPAAFGTAGCPADIASVTAFKIVNQDFVKGEVGGVKILLDPSGNVEDDVYVNNVALGRAKNLKQPVPPTPNSAIRVVASTIGDFVWEDYNGNGIQDFAEPGVKGVRVELRDAAGIAIDSVDSGDNGEYTFGNLHSGDYQIRFIAPTGRTFTLFQQGTDTGLDSDAGPTPAAVTLGVDEDNPTIDAGLASAPSISIVKSINGDDANEAPGVTVAQGSMMNITYLVTNTGKVPLTAVTVTDDKPVTELSCPKDVLAAGEFMTCTAKLPAPEPGVQHTNTGTVVGTPPAGENVSDDDPANANVVAVPGIGIIKKINGDDADTAPGVAVYEGSSMAITYEVTNSGNVTLTNVTVTDDNPVMGLDCPKTVLAAGESMTCNASLAAPAPGVQHTDVGTVVGTPPEGPSVTDDNPANAIVSAVPAISIVKYINDDDANLAPGVEVAEDSIMNISYLVVNRGNVTLTDVKVTDDIIDSAAISCPKTTLAPGEEMLCTTTYPAPVVGAQHTNMGTVTGVPPEGPPVTDEDPANAFATPPPPVSSTTIPGMVTTVPGATTTIPGGTTVPGGATPNDSTPPTNPITGQPDNIGSVDIGNPSSGSIESGSQSNEASRFDRLSRTGAELSGLITIGLATMAAGIAIVSKRRKSKSA